MYPDILLALGCPIGRRQQSWAAEERFQFGWMLWRHSTDTIHVLYNSSGTFQVTDNIYIEGEPEDACPTAGSAPEWLFKPKRGFNRQWCNIATATYLLGWAAEQEVGYEAVWQEFERGHAIVNHSNYVFVFYDDSTWGWY